MATTAAASRSTARTKDLSIQTLRGLACILVVAYHVRGAGPTQGLHLGRTDTWSRIIDSLVYLRMPLFSFLSGYVYALRPLRDHYGPFARGKARRLLIPLLVVGTAFAVLQSVSPGTNGSVADEIPWYQWHIIPIRHLWFLESIFWVFLAVGLLDRYRKLERVPAVLGLGVACVAADAVVPVGNDLLGVRMALYLFPFFLAGAAAHRFAWRTAPRPAKALVLGSLVPLVAVTQLGVWGAIDAIPSRHSPVAAALGICACLALLLTRWTWSPLVWVGGFSFTIYIVHPLGGAAMRKVLDTVGVGSATLNMVAGILAGLAVGIALELVARRSKVGRLVVLGQRWGSRSRPPGRHAAGRPAESAVSAMSAMSPGSTGPTGPARLGSGAARRPADHGPHLQEQALRLDRIPAGEPGPGGT